MKRICTLLITLILITPAFPQKLTTKQKRADFEFTFNEIKNNYPFLGVLKRTHGIDWVANYNKYLKMVDATKTDKEFVEIMSKILDDVHNGHTHIILPHYFDHYYKSYNTKWLPSWQKVVVAAKPHYEYWKEIYEVNKAKDEYAKKTIAKAPENKPQPRNAKIFKQGDFAMISISQMLGGAKLNDDKKILEQYYDSIADCKNLIINIAGNSGGSDKYWRDNIIKYLISKPLIYNNIVLRRNSKSLESYYGKFFKGEKLNRATKLESLAPEVTNRNYREECNTDTLIPNGKCKFKGKLWLLVNEDVFSSSESFSYVTKATGWATIIGTQTGGDGVGMDPIIMNMPNSGICFRYPGMGGLNCDGSFNFETKTTPDVKIEGVKTRHELIAKSVAYIDSSITNVAVPPHVIGVKQFENGDKNVSPFLTKITFKFNEPLNQKSFGGTMNGECPKFQFGEYSEDRMELDIIVVLKPDTHYQLKLYGRAMYNDKGEEVENYILNFTTAKE